MHVDLEHAGIGRDLDDAEARVEGRRVAFQADGLAGPGGGRLDGGDQGGVVRAVGERRQEHAEVPVARLDRQRRAHRLGRVRAGGGSVAAQRAAAAGSGTAAGNARRSAKGSAGWTCGKVHEGDLGQAGERQPQADGRGCRAAGTGARGGTPSAP